MRAVRFHDYDGLEGLTIDEIAAPVPKAGELLVRVHAAGLNPFDSYAVQGYVNAFVTFALPAILGRDFSGVVEAVGPDVADFAVGDAVFGQAAADADGTFADYVTVPAARAARQPLSLSHVEAASFPNVLMAAWNGLFSTVTGLDLKRGQRILVNGAAGGIGNVATQLAVWHGASVIGTASAANLDLLAELGAEPRDYADPAWADGIGPVDGVLDTADGSSGDRLCEMIRPGGSYVALRGFPSETFAAHWAANGIVCRVANGPDSIDAWREMAAAVGRGAAKSVVTATFPLERFRDAMGTLGTGHARGKTVLVVQE